MVPNFKLHTSIENDVLIDVTKFQSAMGLLMYAAISTRLDIAFAVKSLAKYNIEPSKTHWKAVMKIFGYFKRTKNVNILYDMCRGYTKLEVTGFNNGGNNVETVSSCPTSGWVYKMDI